MTEYPYVRCLFCMTGYENELIRLIEAEQLGKAIFPTKIKRLKIKGNWVEVIKPLFPGYVFVYSEEAYPIQIFYRYRQVIRVLQYNDTKDGYLKATDLQFAQWIREQHGQLQALKAIRVGDQVKIVDGIFQKMNGRILALDKRKQAAKIELDVIGGIKQVWMSFIYLEEEMSLGRSCDSVQ